MRDRENNFKRRLFSPLKIRENFSTTNSTSNKIIIYKENKFKKITTNFQYNFRIRNKIRFKTKLFHSSKTVVTIACILATILFTLSISSQLKAFASRNNINNNNNNNYFLHEPEVKNKHHHYVNSHHHYNQRLLVNKNKIPSLEDSEENDYRYPINNHFNNRIKHHDSYATTTPRHPIKYPNNEFYKHRHHHHQQHQHHNNENLQNQGDIEVINELNNNNNNDDDDDVNGKIINQIEGREKFDLETNNQQVPKQLPIVVVSSSDNSYVSASPINFNQENSPSQTTTTTTAAPTTTKKDINTNNQDYLKSRVDANYRIRTATIIKTRESIESGAKFINYTIVTNLDACLVECWITDSCDTAIYQESPVDFNDHLPYNSPESQEDHDSLMSLQFEKNRKKFRINSDNQEDEEDAYGDANDEDDDDEDDENDDENLNNGDINFEEKVNRDEIYGGDYNEQDEKEIENNINIMNGNNDNFINKEKKKMRKINAVKEQKFLDSSKNLGFFLCYLFQCAKSDGFKCQFSPHNYYISSVKEQSLNEASTMITAPTIEENLSPKYKNILPIDFIKTLRPTIINNDDDAGHLSASENNNLHYTVDEENGDNVKFIRGFLHTDTISNNNNKDTNYNKVVKPHYSKIVKDFHQPSINGRRWHDTHVASIKIGQEDYDDYGKGGWNSALIAIMFGIVATAMIIMVVGHKMNSIKRRIAIKGRRRSIVPDTDFLINTLPM